MGASLCRLFVTIWLLLALVMMAVIAVPLVVTTT
jgi:hypothetical protein